MNNIFVETTIDNDVIITGDICVIINHRRANRLLRDTLNCSISGDKIAISNVADFSHCFDRINYIAKMAGCNVNYARTASEAIDNYLLEEKRFDAFSKKALLIRNNECDLKELQAFKDALIDYLPCRTLYDLQLLASFHLAFSQNACNFSVPGAGKTCVVYGAYAYLKNLPSDDVKKIDKLLIIGPLSSFSPWELEYEECFGLKPQSKRLTGQMALEEKRQYLYENNTAEIILLSYASVYPLINELQYFLKKNNVMVVLDEAHKIKNINGGIYAQSVLALAEQSHARVVLTGTPAPNGYEDLYNLFKFIWPTKKVIRFQPGQLRDMSRNENDQRVKILLDQISPYFMRVKKSDLNIPTATIHPPIVVPMKEKQRKIYDFIEKQYMRDISNSKDRDFKAEIVKARIIRLMQAASNPALLKQPLAIFAEMEGIDLSSVYEEESIINTILRADLDEVPAKFEVTLNLVRDIIDNKGKVVIWACYIKTIKDLSLFLTQNGIVNQTLYGGTPVANNFYETESDEYELTRETIVKKFNDIDSGLNVIIANPFAVAESISLHKACHNAIYLERSFNAAHFIQSKDRIHRYGLPKNTITNYYYLVSENSIDETIDERLALKEARLIEIMESMPIPLFSDYLAANGDEDIKAVLRDYARRIKTQ